MAKKDSKQRREASKQLNKKLKLERKLSKKIRRFLKKINRDFLRVYLATEALIRADEYQEELTTILDGHYRKTAEEFAPITVKVVNDALIDAGHDPVPQNDPILIAALLAFISQNVQFSSRVITNTTNTEMARAVRLENGDGKKAKKRLDHRAVWRSETIGATETLKAAEGAKSVAMEQTEEIAQTATVAAIVFRSIKTWFARVFEENTRPAHRDADSQTVPANEPFIVMGQQLMYPGDTWLGATLDNTANCRCTSIHSTTVI